MVRKMSIDTFLTQSIINNTEHFVDEDKKQHLENLLFSWLKSSQHLPNNYDKKFVANFLRASKFSLEEAKKRLESQFVARTSNEMLSNRTTCDKDIIRAMNNVNLVCLPNLTENGELISIFKLANSNADDFDMAASCKLFFMILDLILTTSHPTNGHIVIFDGTNFTSNHLFKFMSPALKTAISLLRESYAIRIKQIHVVNGPPSTERLISCVKPFLSKTIQKRFIVHKSEKTLCDYFNVNTLPSNYGGNLKSIESLMEDWQQLLNDNEEWFEVQNTCTAAPGYKLTEKRFQETTGLEGSFRRLEID